MSQMKEQLRYSKKLDRIKSNLAESEWEVRTLDMKIGSEAGKP